jgi:hypothetical protein
MMWWETSGGHFAWLSVNMRLRISTGSEPAPVVMTNYQTNQQHTADLSLAQQSRNVIG